MNDIVVEVDDLQPIEFESLLVKAESLLELVRNQQPMEFDEATKQAPKTAGIYVFRIGDKAVYVGRARNIRSRLKGHISGTAATSTYAFLLAREKTGTKPTYKTKGSRSDLLKNDQAFKAAFTDSILQIKKMNVNYVEVEDDNLQYFFEFYSAIKLKSKHNKFRTT